MPKNEKETKMKRIIIIAGVAVVACVVLFLGISHHRGKTDNNDGRQHFSWNKDTSLSSEQEGSFLTQKEDEAQSGKTYLGLESLRETLGEKKYQTFKSECDSYLATSGAPECETVALAWPEIESDDEKISCYLQTDDEANSLYQFIYRIADESYSFVTVDELPYGDVNPEIPVQSEEQSHEQDSSDAAQNENTTDNKATQSASQNNDQTNSAASGSDTSTSQSSSNSSTSSKYHTVNGVQFENMEIYEMLSEKAVDLFTKDVTNHWSKTGEDRRLIGTTKPEKKGSKVTFTCTFPDGGDSFDVSLDLNKETFSYSE